MTALYIFAIIWVLYSIFTPDPRKKTIPKSAPGIPTKRIDYLPYPIQKQRHTQKVTTLHTNQIKNNSSVYKEMING